MAEQRRAKRDVEIPAVVNWRRRRQALKDIPWGLRTYFPHIFFQEFTPDRLQMIGAIEHAARYAGDKAIAGPRGDGKTRTALFTSLLLMFAGVCRFPLITSKNQPRAARELKNVKAELEFNQLLFEDFPEICAPVRALEGWGSKARMQTVQGQPTRMEWADNNIILPTVPKLEKNKGYGAGGGAILAALGLDGAIRGLNFNNVRPDLVIIDDPDDRESANSEKQTAAKCDVIDQDIAGLGGPNKRVSRLILCTLINDVCCAAIYTDRKQKPSWAGERNRMLVTEPTRQDLVEQYIEMRRGRDPDNDPSARVAHRFWVENQKEIEAGGVVSNPQRYTAQLSSDGEPEEVSALQHIYNIIADIGRENFDTEYQNDPPKPEGAEEDKLNSLEICKRLSGFDRRVVPHGVRELTTHIDLGKHRLHWAMLGHHGNAAADVLDYGVWHVSGVNQVGIEEALLSALEDLHEHLETDEPWVTPDGEVFISESTKASSNPRSIALGAVDVGHWNTVGYKFCLKNEKHWRGMMGPATYKAKVRRTKDFRPGFEYYESRQRHENQTIWVINHNTHYYKQRAHQGLQVDFTPGEPLPSGCLRLWGDNPSTHRDSETGNFVRQLLAERHVVEPPLNGKPGKRWWKKVSKANHYFDNVAGALALGAVLGLRPTGPVVEQAKKRKRVKLSAMQK